MSFGLTPNLRAILSISAARQWMRLAEPNNRASSVASILGSADEDNDGAGSRVAMPYGVNARRPFESDFVELQIFRFRTSHRNISPHA